MNISFIITLKDRINLKYENSNQVICLELLPNNLNSLKKLIKKEDNWEFIVIDFASSDANVEDFLKSTLNLPNLKYKLITLNENFNKGKALNLGATMCSYDTIFCLDCDMMIKTYQIFNDIQRYVVDQGKVFFPICWSYSTHKHTSGWKRDTGLGNVICLKKDFHPYIEKNTWGGEDDNNYSHFKKLNKTIREYYGDQFVHQWHPPSNWHK
jgi:glycosyltransferase involved in cell wall biosynthesis